MTVSLAKPPQTCSAHTSVPQTHLQRMPKLMEERLHLPESHQAGLVADGWRLVANHVRNR